MREECQAEREAALEQQLSRLEQQHQQELSRVRDSVGRERDATLQALRRDHEVDLKQQRSAALVEADRAVRVALQMQQAGGRASADGGRPGADSPAGGRVGSGSPHLGSVEGLESSGGLSTSGLVIKLQREIKQLREARRRAEETVERQRGEIERLRLEGESEEVAAALAGGQQVRQGARRGEVRPRGGGGGGGAQTGEVRIKAILGIECFKIFC